MRKIPLIALAGSVTIGAAALSSGAIAKELAYGSYVPPNHVIHTHGVEPWFKAITKDTDGSITWQLFSGGSVVSGKNTLNAIESGTVDAGGLVDVYTPSELPVSTTISDLMLLGKDPRVMAAAVNELVLLKSDQLRNDYLKHGVVPLGVSSTTPYYLMCTEPVDSLEKINGKKVRATSAMGVLAASMNAVPVNVTSAEIYEAMQRGQADCAMGAAAWLKNYSLDEVVKYVIEFPLGTYHGSYQFDVSKKTWDKLKPNEKEAFLKNTPHAIAMLLQAYMKDDSEVKDLSSSKGVKWIPADESLKQAFEKQKAGEPARVAEVAKGRGVENPAALISEFQSLVEKWTKIVGGTGDDWGKFEQALQTEIYDKIDPATYASAK